MKNILEDFCKYCIGIQTADGHRHCIRGWYLDQRFKYSECPSGYNMYEFREDDKDDGEYIAYVEPYVLVNHSGTFITRTRLPFNEEGNKNVFKIRYGHFY